VNPRSGELVDVARVTITNTIFVRVGLVPYGTRRFVTGMKRGKPIMVDANIML
jgi:hypothetical protein